MLKINEAVWHDYDQGGYITQKLETIKKWIPEDVHSILDVGCGNGIICNALAQDYDVTGIDISETALKAVSTKKIQCSATDIPLPDGSFDLVFSSEMLEHLTEAELKQAVAEMKRISTRYILISVPNREQLSNTMVKCASCRMVYHAYGHLHSFTTEGLGSQFQEYQVKRSLQFGPLTREFNPVLLWIKQHWGGQYHHPEAPVLCPGCKSSSFIQVSNPVSKACNFLNKLLSKTKPYWLMVLFEKE